jgi:hypothetical protein
MHRARARELVLQTRGLRLERAVCGCSFREKSFAGSAASIKRCFVLYSQHVTCSHVSVHLTLQIFAAPHGVAQLLLQLRHTFPRFLQRGVRLAPAQALKLKTTFQFAFSHDAGVARSLHLVHSASPLLVRAPHGVVELDRKLFPLPHLIAQI